MRIHDPDDRPLALAGLWTGRKDEATGEWLRTFTIVTTRPNGFMASIHDRMPVVVPPESWATWLDPAPRDPGELRALLEPRDDVGLAAYPVSTLVNNVRNDGPELILPAGTRRQSARAAGRRERHGGSGDDVLRPRRQPGLRLARRPPPLPSRSRSWRSGTPPQDPRPGRAPRRRRRREPRRRRRPPSSGAASTVASGGSPPGSGRPAGTRTTSWAPENAAPSTHAGSTSAGASSVTTRTPNAVRYESPSATSAGSRRGPPGMAGPPGSGASARRSAGSGSGSGATSGVGTTGSRRTAA